jgi:hypothetical protein
LTRASSIAISTIKIVNLRPPFSFGPHVLEEVTCSNE